MKKKYGTAMKRIKAAGKKGSFAIRCLAVLLTFGMISIPASGADLLVEDHPVGIEGDIDASYLQLLEMKNNSGYYAEFTIADLDDDGVPELIMEPRGEDEILAGHGRSESVYVAYTFDNVHLVRLGILRGGAFLYKPLDGAGIILASQRELEVYRYEKKRLVLDEDYHFSSDDEDETEEFNQAIEDYLADENWLECSKERTNWRTVQSNFEEKMKTVRQSIAEKKGQD